MRYASLGSFENKLKEKNMKLNEISVDECKIEIQNMTVTVDM